MKFTASLIALLISSLTLGAQDRNGQTAQSFPVTTQLISLACPVSMQAQQRGSSQLVAVQNGKRMQTPGQRISLTLRSATSPRITAARVYVHGLTPKGHVLQAGATDNLASKITRTMTVTFDDKSNGGVTGELELPGFTSVTSIELQEISYEDGTVWNVDDHKVCRVVPDLLMMISDR
jgi:hypothetical protein